MKGNRKSRTRASSSSLTSILSTLRLIRGLSNRKTPTSMLSPLWMASIFAALLSSYLGCDPPSDLISGNGSVSQVGFDPSHSNSAEETGNSWQDNPLENNPVNPATSGRREAIIIGSFNIQTFGRAKMSQPEVAPILADIARRFDILAIQELRDRSHETIPEFLALINQDGSQFRAAVSPRISYQNSTYAEQLVYIYDSQQIELLGTPYVADDPEEQMFRPPFVAHFRCRAYPQEYAFSFVLMNVHVAPQRTAIEFTALEPIIDRIRRNHPQEDDFILLGDLNEEPGRFVSYRWFQNQTVAIPSRWKTNTRLTKNYDNLVFDALRTSEFMKQAGVMNMVQEYQLTLEQALQISDHLPVWAVFSTKESRAADLTQGVPPLR